MPDERSRRPMIVAAFAAVYLIWGSTYLGIRFAIETLPPFLMAAGRFIGAGLVLYLFARLRGAARPRAHEIGGAAIIGALLLLGGNGAVVWAQQRIPSGVAALLVATVPLWMVLIEWMRPGGRRPTLGVSAGLLLGLVGLALLIGVDDLQASDGVDLVGALVLTTGAISWSFGSVFAKRVSLPSHPLAATGLEMIAGGVLLGVLGLASGELARFDLAAVSTRSLIAWAYLLVFGSLIGFTAYIWLLGAVAPAKVATYAYVNPVVAVFLGWALAGEALTSRMVVAAGVIVAAVALITIVQSSRAAPAPGPDADATDDAAGGSGSVRAPVRRRGGRRLAAALRRD